MPELVRIGTAGWAIPKQHAAVLPGAGTHLQRYADRFSTTEINTSFYRPHRPSTYARWAASVPAEFRFAVKMPREITHRRKLVDAVEPLEQFLEEVAALGDKLGPLLVQLPPSLAYDEAKVRGFFHSVRERFARAVACEPRHASWFTDAADAMLREFRVARVAADPALMPRAAVPGGWPGLTYRRLHGSPRVYYSAYSETALDVLASAMREDCANGRECWCIFDNTTLGEAAGNALALTKRFNSPSPCGRGS